jgi:predicted ATP-dependent endonuclease of OLD family
MAQIVHIGIKNFRGIKYLETNITSDFNCLVGRGDSCKTTILHAISSALSPSWNLNFSDLDFYNCDITEPFEITISLIDVPQELLIENKFGLYIRGFNKITKKIVDDLLIDDFNGELQEALTIKLLVDSTLEPNWFVTNDREHEDKQISANDRARFNCYMVSDYVDKHFSWNKGNPLYALLKNNSQQEENSSKNIAIDALRHAKEKINEHDFEELSFTIDQIKSEAASIGLDLGNTNTTIDFKELLSKEGRLSLHDYQVPFRLKGKGSKRLASIAIQSALTKSGGIMLIDEIEQGLEPDRIKLLSRVLKEENHGQIFMTTHSRDVITELDSTDLIIIHHNRRTSEIIINNFEQKIENLQKCVRACPEAFFAKKVIVCEGATEVGICRAFDQHRQLVEKKPPLSFTDCAYIDGTGNELESRAVQLNDANFKVAILCDSDQIGLNSQKTDLANKGIRLFDCETNNDIETQIFLDLPWKGINELIEYVIKANGWNENVIKSKVQKYFDSELPENWLESDTVGMRIALAEASTNKETDKDKKSKDKDKNKKKKTDWFKRVDHGEFLGSIIFKYIVELKKQRIGEIFNGLSSWIDD